MKKQRPETGPVLNQEILEEILARVPVKSLVRFKSVCKSWKHLISSSRFTNLHLKQSIDHNRSKLIYLSNCSTPILEYKPRDRASMEEEDDECYEVDTAVLAYCNGLFCVSIGNDVYLHNPSTNECRKIADSAVEFPPCSTGAITCFGLGYCSKSDDYKLARISVFDKVDPFQAEVKVYSRNSGTWRRIGDFPYDVMYCWPGVFANGSLHWIVWACGKGGDYQRGVAKLNLKDESYGLVRLPEFGSQERKFFKIGSLDEKLIVFYISEDGTSSIWIPEEHGRVESWTRIKIAVNCVSGWHAIYFQPICFLEPGKILLRIDAGSIAIFDVKKKQCYDVHLSYIFYLNIASYMESLVSPYPPSLDYDYDV